MNKLIKTSALAALVALGSSISLLANTVILTAGSNTTSFDSSISNVWGTGTVIASTSGTFSSPTLNGNIYSWVESGVASNPFANGLTFFYTIENVGASGAHAVSELTVDGWAGFATAVAQDNFWAGLNAAPNSYTGTESSKAKRSGDGDVMHFEYDNPEMVFSASSFDLVVYSDADSYTFVDAGVIDGTGTYSKVVGAAIPDAGMTAVLLGLGLLGVAGYTRRSKKA